MFPFVLFMYFPSISWGGVPPGDGERRHLLNVVGVAGLPHTSVGAILVSLDPPDKFALLQRCDGLPCRVLRAPTVRRDGFDGWPAFLFLSCTAHQEAVHYELDRRQVITEKRVAEFEKPFSYKCSLYPPSNVLRGLPRIYTGHSAAICKPRKIKNDRLLSCGGADG